MGDFLEKAKKFGEKAADMTGDAIEIGKYKAKIASRRSLRDENTAIFMKHPRLKKKKW